jgi:hypothetical protein
MDLPTLFLPAGPMLRGHRGGTTLGSGSDMEVLGGPAGGGDHRAGLAGDRERDRAVAGHCMRMGTASTMTSTAEALGVTLPGSASIPAADSRHAVMASRTGRRIVEVVWEDLKALGLVTRAAFRNAISTSAARSYLRHRLLERSAGADSRPGARRARCRDQPGDHECDAPTGRGHTHAVGLHRRASHRLPLTRVASDHRLSTHRGSVTSIATQWAVRSCCG